MTGPREAGVLIGLSNSRREQEDSQGNGLLLALDRIAASLEGIEVSIAALTDVVEAQIYADDEEVEHDA